MADNLVARSFRLAPAGMRVPREIVVADLKGRKQLSAYLGKVMILPVWAEWCSPCLVELGDLARLQQRLADRRFSILPVLSGPNDLLEPSDVATILEKARATAFAPLMEERSGNRLYKAMTSDAPVGQTPGSLPCTLLIDEEGVVVARQWGAGDGASGGPDWRWSSPVAEAFVKALATGFLDQM
jgi:thiol-disulfide isomerase/thioredoxin